MSKSRKVFRPKAKLYKLAFAEDHDLSGLEVIAKPLKIGQLIELGKLADVARANPKEQIKAVDDLISELAELIVSWNLGEGISEDDEETLHEGSDEELLPVTSEALRRLDDWAFFAILDAYMDAAVTVPDPLSKNSSNGERYPEELPPMDEL